MANFYQVNGRCTAWIAGQLKKIQYKAISHVEMRHREGAFAHYEPRCIIHLKNGTKKEIKIVDYDET